MRVLILTLLAGSCMASDPTTPPPVMVDATHGWSQQPAGEGVAILYTSDHGKAWRDVTPTFFTHLDTRHSAVAGTPACSLTALDARSAWIALVPRDEHDVLLACTEDGGLHWWQEKAPTPVETTDARISFVDARRGFLLALSDPAAGKMRKSVYTTGDGGRHWQPLPALPEGRYYPTGIDFRTVAEGWVSATYHGIPDAPLFQTLDGGNTWHLQVIPIPLDYRGGYADTWTPVFTGETRLQGRLPVKLVRHEPKPGHVAWVTYESTDGGKSWRLPATGVRSFPDD